MRMKNLENLVSGYKKFLMQEDKDRYHSLAVDGQFPKIMVIGCSDSRVNPDLIFNARPGELFVVRNVANLVPPYEDDEAYHGTGAALEFAVKGLQVEHIVVMGHSLCGGVNACCRGVHGEGVEALKDFTFIPTWTSILNDCAKEVLSQNPDIGIDALSHKVEHAAIRESLKNLRGFPFIADGLKDERLQIHGAYFDIKDAQVYALDKATDDFLPVG